MLSIPHQLVGVPIGHEVTIECFTEAHPTSLNYWTRDDGHMIHDSKKYRWVYFFIINCGSGGCNKLSVSLTMALAVFRYIFAPCSSNFNFFYLVLLVALYLPLALPLVYLTFLPSYLRSICIHSCYSKIDSIDQRLSLFFTFRSGSISISSSSSNSTSIDIRQAISLAPYLDL